MNLPSLTKPAFLAAALLTVLSIVCVVGAGFRTGDFVDSLRAETEQSEQRHELDDVDDLEVIVSHEVSLHSSDAFCELLQTHHDCPLLTHTWRWCSRGPPAA